MQALETIKARIQLTIKNIMPITLFGNIQQRLVFVNDEETASRFVNESQVREPQAEETTRPAPAPRNVNPWFWVVILFIGFWLVTNLPSCSYSPFTTSNLESQVRTWASDYPDALRDRWAWCYLDSAENWSTDQKLREDVRLKSVQVLTDTDRQTLLPLDAQIAATIPKQKTPLKETYDAVGKGLRVNIWSPLQDSRRQTADGGEDIPPPEPIRRRIVNRR